MVNVSKIIQDIKTESKINNKKLFVSKINERLDLALKSYYADLSYKINTYENAAIVNNLKVAKKLNKLYNK